MLRPRVSLSTTTSTHQPPTYVIPDLSIPISDIDYTPTSISVPSTIAIAIKEVIKDKAPSPLRSARISALSPLRDEVVIPFVYEPIFSGADLSLDSNENRTVISRAFNNIRVKCDTILLPIQETIPIRIYLTGKELDLKIDGQRCTVDIFSDVNGYSKLLGVAKRDEEGYVYVEVQDRGVEWSVTGGEGSGLRFHIDTLFSIK